MAFLIVVISATFFTWALPIVQAYRLDHPWLLYAMPILIIFILWDHVKKADLLSSRAEISALRDGDAVIRSVSWFAGVKQILMTLVAHLFGASVGREAVGIQLGGWAARLRNSRGWYFGACLAAGFSIVLGTPFAAAIFIFESKRWKLSWKELLGVPILAWTAFRFSVLAGVSHVEYRTFDATRTELQSIGFANLAVFFASLVVCSVLLGLLFLTSVERAGRRKPEKINQVFLPLVFLSLVGLVFGYFGGRTESTGLPGLGVAILPGLWLAEPDFFTVFNHPFLFGVLKVFLTAGFVGIGVRGGELTPLLVGGAMIAVGLGGILNVPISGLVAVGFPLIWGIAARRPVTAAIIAVELFGFRPWGSLALLIFILVIVGVKLGDLALAKFPNIAGVWSRGLYDQ